MQPTQPATLGRSGAGPDLRKQLRDQELRQQQQRRISEQRGGRSQAIAGRNLWGFRDCVYMCIQHVSTLYRGHYHHYQGSLRASSETYKQEYPSYLAAFVKVATILAPSRQLAIEGQNVRGVSAKPCTMNNVY